MQNLWAGVIFFLAFFSIRRFAGGFHAETRVRCFVISILIIVGAMKGISLLCDWYSFHMILISGICSIIIGAMAPIESERRKLSIQEKLSYKNSLLLILLSELAISILLALFEQKMTLVCVTMAIVVSCFLNVLEVLRRKMDCNCI